MVTFFLLNLMNNYRTFNKKTVIQGLETDSSYSSDIEDYQQNRKGQNNFSNQIFNFDNQNQNQNNFGIQKTTEDTNENQFNGCSKETVVLLKTRTLFDDPIKRLLSIWPSLYTS